MTSPHGFGCSGHEQWRFKKNRLILNRPMEFIFDLLFCQGNYETKYNPETGETGSINK